MELQGRLYDEGRGRGVDWERGRAKASAGASAVGRGGSVHARAKRALWARPKRAHQAFGEMPEHARRRG